MTFKKILLTFLNGKKKEIGHGYEIFINHNDEDSWVEIGDNTIGSYPRLLLKFMNKESNNVFFVFLENANFVVTNDEIDIKTFSEMNFFKESKKPVLLNDKISTNKKRILELTSNQFFGWSIEEIMELENLEYKNFVLTMRKLLKLEEVEDYE